MKKSFLILLFALTFKSSLFAVCEYKNETRAPSVENITKSVTEYTKYNSGTSSSVLYEAGDYKFTGSPGFGPFADFFPDSTTHVVIYGYVQFAESGRATITCSRGVMLSSGAKKGWCKYTVPAVPASCDGSGYTISSGVCKKTQTYTYKKYMCDALDKNIQGFGWEISEGPDNDGVKVDPSVSQSNDLSSTVYSHSIQPECTRKYQECTIGCDAPLVYDEASNKCVISYTDACAAKGLVYNSTLNICEKDNQCVYADAYKSKETEKCEMLANCNVINGVCGDYPDRYCANDNYEYFTASQKCEKNNDCSDGQFVSSKSKCSSTPFCDAEDVETIDSCVNTVNVVKSCGIDGRSGNLCYVSNATGENNSSINYKRPLIKNEYAGSYKISDYGNKIETLCSDDASPCQFRITKIDTQYDGHALCFTDAQGVESCIYSSEGCSFEGEINYQNGIKQLKVVDGNKIVGYNIEDSTESIGSIKSTCSISGKVGSFEGMYTSSDITSIKADGANIMFWDEFKRGFIGVISVLPTIPEEDLNDGFAYEDANVYMLLSKGFTGFYSEDSSAVYAVYNGFISKGECESLISGTSFYIPQATSTEEEEILEGLSLKSGSNYNYNDGDFENGSCVIKSELAKSFDEQSYSVKKTIIEDSSSIFVCSPLTCADHSCQYNECPSGFSPNVYEQSYFDQAILDRYPDVTQGDVCRDAICDSNKPYFPDCGNKYGCENKPNVYQQDDGTCVKVTCENGEEVDPETGKCISYGCKNSIEKDGRCYRSSY